VWVWANAPSMIWHRGRRPFWGRIDFDVVRLPAASSNDRLAGFNATALSGTATHAAKLRLPQAEMSPNGWRYLRAGDLARKGYSVESAVGAESPQAGSKAPARPVHSVGGFFECESLLTQLDRHVRTTSVCDQSSGGLSRCTFGIAHRTWRQDNFPPVL
jgi:hypothetical protein